MSGFGRRTVAWISHPCSDRGFAIRRRNTIPAPGHGLKIRATLVALLLTLSGALSAPVISEFLAVNRSIRADEDGDFSDWLEIQNSSSSQTVDLDGHFLTDDPDDLKKWRLPSVLLTPGARHLVYASGKDRARAGSELHCNFKLDGGGEYLALVAADGITVLSDFAPAYPRQETDISYGRGTCANDPCPLGYLDPPTPEAPNGSSFLPVKDTRFTHDRGFYDTPIAVGIWSETEDARIRYTTDGSAPSPTRGTLYSAPIQIQSSTVLRAIAFKPGHRPTNVDTQTYLFVADVVRQGARPRGFPTSWAGGGRPDYGMDPQVFNNARYRDLVDDALLALPTISLVMDIDDLFDARTGIYANPGTCCNDANRGPAWERPVSVEYFEPDDARQFQVDAGIRIQGGASRLPDKSPKHSFRLLFKDEYGPSRLDFHLFPDSAANQHDTFTLRAGYLDSWIHDGAWGVGAPRPQAQYVIDKFVHDTFGLMGQLSVNGRFVHLYLNGHYWGLYNPIERVRASWLAENIGGSKDDWDVVNLDVGRLEVKDGDASAYHALINQVTRGVSSPEQLQAMAAKLDLTNLADYMLLNFWIGNNDWPSSNWTAARRRDPAAKYRFFTWDAEASMETVSLNVTGANRAHSPADFFHRLRQNSEFRLLVADRVQKHFFHDGALAPEVAGARYQALANTIDLAVIAESARWGDYRRDVNPILVGPYELYTRDTHWRVEQDRLLRTYFPRRTGIVLNQLRALNLYPNLTAPEFLVNGKPQHGGPVGGGQLSFRAPASGTIYYTTDGSDPRTSFLHESRSQILLDESTPGARALVPSATNGGKDLRVEDWTAVADPSNDARWKTGTTPVGFEAAPAEYADLISLPVPEMWPFNASCYVRLPFTILNESTLANIGSLELEMKYDDGFIAYLNGERIASRNAPAPADTAWNSAATDGHDDEEAVVFELLDISRHRGLLQVGENVLALHGLNESRGSSDFLLSARLTYEPANELSPGAVRYRGGPIVVSPSHPVRARLRAGNQWSALTEASFTLTARPATTGDLLITEIHYRPLGPQSPDEEAAGAARKEFEFLELMNVSSDLISLGGVSFLNGVSIAFAGDTTLGPNERIVLASNGAAFEERYGFAPGGVYAGSLSNDGEPLTLLDAGGSLLLDFEYNDQFPWPESADGEGFSLTLRAPETKPALSDPRNWKPSVAPNGSPGTSDARPFNGDPNGDENGNGLPDLLDHALTNRQLKIGFADDDPGGETDTFPTISYQRDLRADGVRIVVETSRDLVNWTSESVLVAVSNNGDGSATETWRALRPQSGAPMSYLRLRVELK